MWLLLPLVATSKFGLFAMKGLSPTRNYLFLYPQAGRSGLTKPKKKRLLYKQHEHYGMNWLDKTKKTL